MKTDKINKLVRDFLHRDMPEEIQRRFRRWMTAPADRETVAMILYRSGFEVREKKVKEGGRTVAYLEYRKAGAE